MINIKLSRILTTIACVTTIFLSQQALAIQHNLVLLATDNSEVGQGQYEELKDEH